MICACAGEDYPRALASLSDWIIARIDDKPYNDLLIGHRPVIVFHRPPL